MEAGLSEERGLLIARDASDRHSGAEQGCFPDGSARGHDPRQHGLGDPEELEELAIPVERLQVEEERPGGVRDVGRVDLAVRELPEEPRIDRAEREARRVALGQDPLQLRRRKIWVGDQPGAVTDQVPRQLSAAFGRAPVLPDDRAVDGPAAAPVPDDGRLALIRQADGREVGRLDPGSGESVFRRAEDGLPELLRLVLHPARTRKILRHFAVAAPPRPQLLVDHEAGCPGCPLVDGEEHGLVVRLAVLPRS